MLDLIQSQKDEETQREVSQERLTLMRTRTLVSPHPRPPPKPPVIIGGGPFVSGLVQSAPIPTAGELSSSSLADSTAARRLTVTSLRSMSKSAPDLLLDKEEKEELRSSDVTISPRRDVIVKEGWLSKKGGQRRNWNTRWCVLRPTEFAYYKSQKVK